MTSPTETQELKNLHEDFSEDDEYDYEEEIKTSPSKKPLLLELLFKKTKYHNGFSYREMPMIRGFFEMLLSFDTIFSAEIKRNEQSQLNESEVEKVTNLIKVIKHTHDFIKNTFCKLHDGEIVPTSYLEDFETNFKNLLKEFKYFLIYASQSFLWNNNFQSTIQKFKQSLIKHQIDFHIEEDFDAEYAEYNKSIYTEQLRLMSEKLEELKNCSNNDMKSELLFDLKIILEKMSEAQDRMVYTYIKI